DAAPNLMDDGRRIDRVTAVHSAHHAMNLQLALVHRNFRNLCFEAADVGRKSDPAESSRRRRSIPTDFLGSKIEHAKKSRLLCQQATPEFQRILARGRGHLIDEAFCEERVL